MLGRAVAVVLLVAACVAAPGAAAGPPASSGPPVIVLHALPGGNPRPATGRQAVALARANVDVPGALARPYKAELGWTAQWQGHEWWLVGVFESDWGARFVVRAAVRGRYAQFGAGPTTQWMLANAQPTVTTLYSRFDLSSAVAQMKAELLATPAPAPGSFPDFNPRNYTILDGAAELVQDEPTGPGIFSGPGWWFVYDARDLRTGLNVVLPVAGINYGPAVEGSFEPAPGRTSYGIAGLVWDNVPTGTNLANWIGGVIAARGWRPSNWPSTGHDPSFPVPPFLSRPRVSVAKAVSGRKPSPARARQAVAVAGANLDVADALAQPFEAEQGWTAQWRGHEWWLVGVFHSEWGKRFVVRASVVGDRVRFGAGPGKRWILKHARPRLRKTVYTRLKPSSAAGLLQTEMLSQPTARFDPKRYSILRRAAKLVRDSDSGPAWDVVYYAKDLTTGKGVVLPVTSPSKHPLVETTYDTSTPGSTAYGFKAFDVLLGAPSDRPRLTKWIRSVVAARGWHPTNFH
jgi:hypothetical protein